MTEKRVKVVTPELKSGTLAFSPHRAQGIVCPEWNRFEIQHHAGGEMPLEDVLFLSVVGIDKQPEDPQIMIFVRKSKRPFLVQSSGIDYSEAPFERGSQNLERLRSFLLWLLSRNPKVGIDRSTLEFLRGKAAASLDRDITALATSVGDILREADLTE